MKFGNILKSLRARWNPEAKVTTIDSASRRGRHKRDVSGKGGVENDRKDQKTHGM
jgi:hypothetical protein